MISDRWPETDATVVRFGLRWLLWLLLLIVLPFGGMGVTGLFIVLWQGDASGWPFLPGLVSLFVLRPVWSWRRRVTALDSQGFWVMQGKQAVLIPWDSLAGAGIYWAPFGRTHLYTLELCPRGDIDRDHPLLWEFVRDVAPLRLGLPRLRYRFDVRHFFGVYEEAFRRWAPPGVWFGRVEQPSHYRPGAPDRAGHKRRIREAAARVTPGP
ncbi:MULTISPECIES: hypothetical protein [unclassified Streptomyces]|jgi:hypothetical protein|uniref:hypothetical protein n=1 Tax=unclassified Streptomyces TaxID=2593676 RepID=UPI004042F188